MRKRVNQSMDMMYIFYISLMIFNGSIINYFIWKIVIQEAFLNRIICVFLIVLFRQDSEEIFAWRTHLHWCHLKSRELFHWELFPLGSTFNWVFFQETFWIDCRHFTSSIKKTFHLPAPKQKKHVSRISVLIEKKPLL